jgi:hypothetical protein
MRFRIGLRRALALINLTPSMYYYRRKRDDQPALELMRAYADENPAHGQDMMSKCFTRAMDGITRRPSDSMPSLS